MRSPSSLPLPQSSPLHRLPCSWEFPETLMVIALGAAFATTDPDAFEQHARPFRDVFMVMFFVFFGVTIDFASGVDWFVVAIICMLAILSKLISRMIIGLVIHGSALSGLEIWANMICRGEFSIALAVLYGSPIIATTIAAMVIVTSIVGAFTAKYSTWMRSGIISHSRKKALMSPASQQPVTVIRSVQARPNGYGMDNLPVLSVF